MSTRFIIKTPKSSSLSTSDRRRDRASENSVLKTNSTTIDGAPSVVGASDASASSTTNFKSSAVLSLVGLPIVAGDAAAAADSTATAATIVHAPSITNMNVDDSYADVVTDSDAATITKSNIEDVDDSMAASTLVTTSNDDFVDVVTEASIDGLPLSVLVAEEEEDEEEEGREEEEKEGKEEEEEVDDFAMADLAMADPSLDALADLFGVSSADEYANASEALHVATDAIAEDDDAVIEVDSISDTSNNSSVEYNKSVLETFYPESSTDPCLSFDAIVGGTSTTSATATTTTTTTKRRFQ